MAVRSKFEKEEELYVLFRPMRIACAYTESVLASGFTSWLSGMQNMQSRVSYGPRLPVSAEPRQILK